MSAPTPSLTQLTTTFIGNSSPAIPQIVQVAIFSNISITKYVSDSRMKLISVFSMIVITFFSSIRRTRARGCRR